MRSEYVEQRLALFRPAYIAYRVQKAAEGRRAARKFTREQLSTLRKIAVSRSGWRHQRTIKRLAYQWGVSESAIHKRLAAIRDVLPGRVGGIALYSILCAAIDEARRQPGGRQKRGAGWHIASEARRMREQGMTYREIGAQYGYTEKWAEGVCKGRRWA